MSQAIEVERQLLGTKLKEAREYLGFSQDEVAKVIGISRSAISMLEVGQRKVDALELTKLAKLYQQPVSFFTSEDLGSPKTPRSVEHLARAAAQLKESDREELLRFAQFLQAKQEK